MDFLRAIYGDAYADRAREAMGRQLDRAIFYGTEQPMKDPMTDRGNPNSGHGHVFPRPDKVKARCGGPALCRQCAGDLAALQGDAVTITPPGQPEEVPTFTEAEELGLTVVGVATRLTRERDRARDVAVALEQKLNRATATLRVVLDAFPQTSWAQDSLTETQAREVLAELEDPEG